ncbi:glycosyltransferase family 2 protein [Citreimonas salinaria]|uniref:Glycosyltransferase involved in cell wall bisynthesis n=1 Tax=Citreimonas salinaria TaxID=321339 RepID=A0A1H3N5J2_9RHOB|nr:glycosyltransferase [Citreimonas salinaria]SDY83489.1 Glycosyltransferase involved in cell wall bisynthesis [Citreimonas salinaria]
MNPPLITVIVPAHDVAGHLGACLDSIARQSLADFECLVIDDGSTDGTGAIAHAAAAADPRFRVVAQDNRGLSAARNAGLARARGAFVAFVDGDDRVMPDYLGRLHHAIEAEGADWVACALASVHPDGRGFAHPARHDRARLDAADAPQRCAITGWDDAIAHFPSAWNKLYRRALIDGLTFDEGTWFEDHAFFLQAAARTDHILWLPQALYLQTRGRVGQITGADDDRALQQFPVLDRVAQILRAGPHDGAETALARLACRLIQERCTALHDPARRARFLTAARAWLEARGLAFVPQDDAGRAIALELEGRLPLTVAILWDGRDPAAPAATRAALPVPGMPGHEVLVAGPARPHAEAPGGGARHLPDTATAVAQARGAVVVVLAAGDVPAPTGIGALVAAMLRHDAVLGLTADDPDPAFDPGAGPGAPRRIDPARADALGAGLAGRAFARAFLDRHADAVTQGTAALARRAAAEGATAIRLDWPALPRRARRARLLRGLRDRLLAGADSRAGALALRAAWTAWRIMDARGRAPQGGSRGAAARSFPDDDTAAAHLALARFADSQRHAPAPDPVAVLDALPLPSDAARRAVLLGLSEIFCRADHDTDAFAARGAGLGLAALGNSGGDDPWARSAALPFLYRLTGPGAALAALRRLARPGSGGLTTPPLADLMRCAARPDPRRSRRVRAALLRTAFAILRARAAQGCERTACAELTAAAADLLVSRALPSALSDTVTDGALAVYGLSRRFWDRVGDAPLPPRAARARTAFATLRAALGAPGDAGRTAAQGEDADAALRVLEGLGVLGTARFRDALAAARAAGDAAAPAPALRPHGGGMLELVSPAARLDAARRAPVAVVSVMRNERRMLPHFLAHYRALGVEGFLVADNGSDDGTAEYLAAQPDVALFSAPGSYRAARYGVAWQETLLACRLGRWSLVADADELLVWQHPQRDTLPALLARPAFARAEGVRVFLLDMYPDGPLHDATFEAGTPFDEAGFADRVPFLTASPTRGPFSDGPAWTSALRHRLCPGAHPNLFAAQKIALLRHHPFMRLSEGLHFAADMRLAAPELIFGHFKYNADFHVRARAEATRAEHWDGAAEYHRYAALDPGAGLFDPARSVPWHAAPFVAARLEGAP